MLQLVRAVRPFMTEWTSRLAGHKREGVGTHAGQPITKSGRLRKNMSRVMNAQEPELQDFSITSVGPAAQRARRLLNELHPGVRVHISHDLVGSPRLAELARRADVFVGAGAQQHTLRQR